MLKFLTFSVASLVMVNEGAKYFELCAFHIASLSDWFDILFDHAASNILLGESSDIAFGFLRFSSLILRILSFLSRYSVSWSRDTLAGSFFNTQ